MIGRLRGELIRKGPAGLLVMTNGGVGYELSVPVPLLDRLPPRGEDVELHTALVVRDAALDLYGFETSTDRELFRRLQTVSGVGPRLALAVLSDLPLGRIVNAIRSKDHAVLQTVSGVGRKTAERIAIELTDKLDDLAADDVTSAVASAPAAAVHALRTLGYGGAESQEAVAKAAASLDGADTDTEELIRVALRHV